MQSAEWNPAQWITAIAAVSSALSAFAAAYFGAYAKKKGENLATREDFREALGQLRASTEAVEGIKSTVAARSALVQELRAAVQKLTVATSSMIHSMCWLTWDAQKRRSVNHTLVSRYDDEVHRLSPEISGQLALIATYDLGMHDQLSPLVDRLFSLDAAIGDAVADYQMAAEGDRDAALERVCELHQRALDFEHAHRCGIAGVLSGHFKASETGDADRLPPSQTHRPALF